MGQTGPVRAELSSLSSSTNSMKERVAALADGLHPEKDAEMRSILHEVERSLASAARHLDRAVRLTR